MAEVPSIIDDDTTGELLGTGSGVTETNSRLESLRKTRAALEDIIMRRDPDITIDQAYVVINAVKPYLGQIALEQREEFELEKLNKPKQIEAKEVVAEEVE